MSARRRTGWPSWWNWELELGFHLFERMVDRQFTEADLRLMMDGATGLRRGREVGRWIVETSHESRSWEVILELSPEDRLLIVITAYPVDER